MRSSKTKKHCKQLYSKLLTMLLNKTQSSFLKYLLCSTEISHENYFAIRIIADKIFKRSVSVKRH